MNLFLSEKIYVRELCKNKKCLELGPGQGQFLMADPANRIGLDINEKIVCRLQEKGLQCLHGTADSIPNHFKNTFDIIYIRNLIEHLNPSQLAQCLKSLEGLCVSDASIILITPCESRIWATASHIRPYPPISIYKLLTSPTET